ncbi:MAG: manganese efflux pump [Clostridia bacterium]|nr:manganese efflux pump [Clostridia bacterium]
MEIFEIILIGIGLSMDAFAVSICKGLSMKKFNWKNAIIIATYFGVFQALMPLIGYFLGIAFQGLVNTITHWISFILLTVIGKNMIKESFNKPKSIENININAKNMILLAIATSLDALVVGITFAFFKTNIIFAVFIIGIITFILSLIGVLIGNRFGNKFHTKAELIGGLILILIGIKILLEHLGILNL